MKRIGASFFSVLWIMTICTPAIAESPLKSAPFWPKLEIHIREMVESGIPRDSAEALAFAAFVRKATELCGHGKIPLNVYEKAYDEAIEASRLPAKIVRRHQPIFEAAIGAQFNDDKSLIDFCGL